MSAAMRGQTSIPRRWPCILESFSVQHIEGDYIDVLGPGQRRNTNTAVMSPHSSRVTLRLAGEMDRVLAASMGARRQRRAGADEMIDSVVAICVVEGVSRKSDHQRSAARNRIRSALFVYIRTCEKRSLRDFVPFLLPPEYPVSPSGAAHRPAVWLTAARW